MTCHDAAPEIVRVNAHATARALAASLARQGPPSVRSQPSVCSASRMAVRHAQSASRAGGAAPTFCALPRSAT